MSCAKSDNKPQTQDTNKVRLKYLTTTEEVIEALGAYAAGWSNGELELTDVGSYPNLPYIYYYEIALMNGVQLRRIWAGADGTGEETLEEILREGENRVAVEDVRLKAYTDVFVVKRGDNQPGSWLFSLYAPQVYTNGKTTHMIHFSGFTTAPVPSDEEVITAMLGLLEIME